MSVFPNPLVSGTTAFTFKAVQRPGSQMVVTDFLSSQRRGSVSQGANCMQQCDPGDVPAVKWQEKKHQVT